MTKEKNYFKFWWKSSNEHGVHSPFVFNLLTKGLYPKDSRWKKLAKKNAFPQRVLAYYAPKHIAIIGVEQKIEVTSTVVTCFKPSQGKSDLIWIGSSLDQQSALTSDILYAAMHNDTVLMFDRRKENSVVVQLWEDVVSDERFIVTLDFYYFGLAFIRSEQLKQHFTLRM